MILFFLAAIAIGVNSQEVTSRVGPEHCEELALPFSCGEDECSVHRNLFCDGYDACSNGDDEMQFNASIHHDKGVRCLSKNSNESCFLSKRYQCDHEVDCLDGIDECGCNSTFQCNNGECALRTQFCDGAETCRDGTDEVKYRREDGGFQCQVTKKHVTLRCMLPTVHVCDGKSECNWGIDECFCENGKHTKAYVNEKCFRCLDGTLIIPNHHLCDGIFHCKDLSDECLCSKSEQQRKYTEEICEKMCSGSDCECPGQLICQPKAGPASERVCVQPESICDDTFDCAEGYDEKYCPFVNETFVCANESGKVHNTLVCDGKADCADGSDEKDCHETRIVCSLYTSEKVDWTHLRDWNDSDSHPPLNRTSVVSDLWRFGFSGWQLRFPYYAEKCDGFPLCSDGDDECGDCAERPDFCNFIINQSLTCPISKSKISSYEVCDGQPTCNDTAPHESEDEKGCPGRFYCANRGSTRLPIHIPMTHRCDGLAECDDQSDELDCPASTHFYCTEGGSTLFIPRDQVCDKRKDCKGGEDECDNCSTDPLSSDERLIKSRALIGFLWIIGLISTIGNSVIIIDQVFNIYKNRNKLKAKNTTVAVKNRILVMNLAVADWLVGIYLLTLGIKDASVQQYCLVEQEWKSSNTCAALGTIVLIGTEASVAIMVVMTVYRLRLVYRPFQTQSLKPLILPISLAWIFSIAISVIPLAPTLSEYFLSCVWFRSHRYLGHACKAEVIEFTERLVTMEGPNNTFSRIVGSGYSWSNILNAQKALNSSYVPEQFFGYYAAHSVCLPRFFPDVKNDRSWGYSLMLLLLNFSAFVFILVSYVFIYRKSTSNENSCSNDKRAVALQRKVTRIVLTNFCCWMPICIMGFIKLLGGEVDDIAYAVTAIILLPINSAMNPFLYSSLLDIIWSHVRPVSERISDMASGRSHDDGVRYTKHYKGESVDTSVTNMHVSSDNDEDAYGNTSL